MDDFDQKLKELAREHGVSKAHHGDLRCRCIDGPVGHFVAKVKKLLQEAGYVQVSGPHVTSVSIKGQPKSNTYIGQGVNLSGQEWFDRLTTEFEDAHPPNVVPKEALYTKEIVLKLAKKAAGIE